MSLLQFINKTTLVENTDAQDMCSKNKYILRKPQRKLLKQAQYKELVSVPGLETETEFSLRNILLLNKRQDDG
jgi:hypothetical protein